MSSLQLVKRDRQRRKSSDERKTKVYSSSAHLVGICGAGMKALSEMLTGLGWSVSGSDLVGPTTTIRAMRQRGLRVHRGHHDRFVPRGVDVVVHSPAVGRDNPEIQLAERLKIPVLSYSEMLGRLMQSRVGVSIAGTHGKSTTTAMVASVLADSGLSPSAVFGAELSGRDVGGWAGDGDLFVVEGCEYRRSFLDFSPRYACILGIEPDHFDYFADLDDTVDAFAEFASQVAADGLLLVNRDCAAAMKAGTHARAQVVTLSQQGEADWWAADMRNTRWGTRFRVFRHSDFFAEIELPLPGRHNVANALAAIAMSYHVGASAECIRDSLWNFAGVRRRFEHIGSWRGMTLIDDYAHHPTAVRATIRTAREQFGRRRIWCAFQPHQVSRTKTLMLDFAESFEQADEVLIAPTFAARETIADEHETTSGELALRIAAGGQKARFCHSLDQIVTTLDDEARPGDVLITMGAGDIDQVHHEFTRRIQRNHPPR